MDFEGIRTYAKLWKNEPRKAFGIASLTAKRLPLGEGHEGHVGASLSLWEKLRRFQRVLA
ncbi:hypothetical protein N9414_21435 [Nodularia spumigena CCY9414]|jgi:hypothetical protein|nr:hypothetical protein N9414_21435 [Nodularia spumigena CCY9414]